MGYLIEFLFFALPAASVVFFIISLCRFLSARKQNKQEPGSVDAQEVRVRKTLLITSSVIAFVIVAVFATFIILLMNALTYM